MVTSPFSQNFTSIDKPIATKRWAWILSISVICVVNLTIFQDFIESYRSGYSFYLSESILFKTIWFLFIPMLTLLRRTLENKRLDSFKKTTLFIIIPILIHYIILPFVVLLFSILFYEGRYDLYKLFSYTLANDFYILVLVYVTFVLAFKHFLVVKATAITTHKAVLEKIIVSNGKDNTIVNINDIFHITAATPYILIQLENKKYLHTHTLKSISEQLDIKVFVRVHKSTVVNIEKVVSFKSRFNGDYDLLLKNGDEIRLSRTFATQFKKKFLVSHQDSL